jgi:hypothetical protein
MLKDLNDKTKAKKKRAKKPGINPQTCDMGYETELTTYKAKHNKL